MTVSVNVQTASGFIFFLSTLYDQLANSPIQAGGSATQFTATDTGAFNGNADAIKFVVSGTGLSYTGAFPNIHLSAGTITSTTEYDTSNNLFATVSELSITATAFDSALATYVTGHQPAPAGDGNPNASALDAIFQTLDYNITGNAGADLLQGGNLGDTINGGGGNDYIDGAGGADNMTGGLGNDVYVIDNAGDVVNESAGQGDDAVDTYINYVLPANIEYLNLLGSAPISGTGNDLANIIYGNSVANTISGGAGFDYLDGGAGADTMIGGLDNDNYVVENSGDVIIENPDEGFESVILTATWTMSANVDSVNMQNSAGAINCTGNSIDNQIYGNSSANILSGGGGNDIISGGGGADTMSGGTGDDLCFVDNAGDVVIENANEGIDQIYSTISYTISANVENMNLTVGGLTGTGNNLDNVILGYQGGYTLMGLGGNDTLNGQVGADTMYGGTGNDLYYVENAGDAVIENANEGIDTVHASISYVLTANVENLEMEYLGDLAGTGNALANTITGNSHNNVLDGKAGADTMIGDFGNDSYFVDNMGDLVVESAGAGTDTVNASITYSLPVNVENLTLTGSADLQGYGNAVSNVLAGNSGNNLLNGDTGADSMYGGVGNDVYFVDNAGDAVFENANEGNDSVFSTVSFTLGANVEGLILQGSADLQGYGNGLANTIYGNSGNNLLNGGGGIDLMAGGLGDDVYFADDSSDACFEVANQGNDSVFAACSYGLAADVEGLILQGTGDFQAYGNSQANMIYGNSGNNLINAGGGIDLMAGGLGDDVYYVDDPSDACFEIANQGNDSVFATCSYGLAADVESLILQGSADLQAYGNSQANTIYGNAGNNLINGGAGIDFMAGGAGNDVYYVDNSSDAVSEAANQGNDSVFATASFTLGANVENLILQGSADLQGNGNGQANVIVGNTGNNILNGGAGADQLTGGAGNDTFVFNVGQGAGDAIVDFAGNGAATGDALKFSGYGAGATFTNIDATHWQVNYNGGSSHDIIVFSNGAPIDPTDYSFV